MLAEATVRERNSRWAVADGGNRLACIVDLTEDLGECLVSREVDHRTVLLVSFTPKHP